MGAHGSMGMASDASDLPSGWGRQEIDEDNYDWGQPQRPAGNAAPSRQVHSKFSLPPTRPPTHTERGTAAATDRSRGSRGTAPSVRARAARNSSESLAQIRHEASQRWPGFPLSELKGAGYNAVQLRAVGHTAADLKLGGFGLDELKAAGFTAEELKKARFRAVELKVAGFHAGELREAKFRALDLKTAGFSVAQLKEVNHSASEMKTAGYSAGELKAAKYKAAELREAGYTLTELKAARFKAADLREAGYPAAEPIMVGYTFAELKAGGFPATELLKAAGYSAAELMALHYSLQEILAGGFTADDLVPLGKSLLDLQEVGYKPNAGDLQEYTQKVEVAAALDVVGEGGFMGMSRKKFSVKLNLSLRDIPMKEYGVEMLFA